METNISYSPKRPVSKTHISGNQAMIRAALESAFGNLPITLNKKHWPVVNALYLATRAANERGDTYNPYLELAQAIAEHGEIEVTHD